MIDTPSATSGSDQSRLELAMAAATAERANKPRWIVFLGVALLAGTIIFALVAASSRTAAMLKVSAEWRRTQNILKLKQDLQREAASLAAKGAAPNNLAGATIERLATERKVTLQPGGVGDSTLAPMTQLGLQQHQYNTRAVNQNPGSILEWLIATQRSADLPGLEITRLAFRPGAGTTDNTPGWNVDVQFSRWEKTR